jgi:hypothetical protein
MTKWVFDQDAVTFGPADGMGFFTMPAPLPVMDGPLKLRGNTTSTSWTAASGNFNTAANWSAGVPTLGVDATIDGTSNAPLTIAYSAGSDTAHTLDTAYTSLNMSAGTLTLQFDSSLSSEAGAFSQTGGEIDLQNGESLNQTSSINGDGGGVEQSAGTIEVEQGFLDVAGNSSFAGTVTGIAGSGALVLDYNQEGATYTIAKGADIAIGTLTLNGGTTFLDAGATIGSSQINISGGATLSLATNLTYAGDFNDLANFINDVSLAGHTLSLTGAAYLGSVAYSATVLGAGTIALSGATTIGGTGGQGFVLGTNAALTNKGVVTQNGQMQIGDGSGNVATVSNAAKGVWSLVSNSGIDTGVNESSSFSNAGTFENTGSNTDPTIASVFTNTGLVSVNAGDGISFDNNFTNTGTISGAGQLAIIGGTAALNAGTVLGVHQFDLFNTATLNLGSNLTYAGIFDDDSNGSNVIDLAGHMLSLTGTADLVSSSYTAMISGTGSVALTGASTVGGTSGSGLLLGGGAVLSNSGMVLQNGQVQIGDGQVASITNSAGGTWNLTTSAGLSTGSDASSSFTNAGLFEDTGSSDASTLSATFTNTGVLSVGKGAALVFDQNLTNTGTISGAGEVVIDAGSATLNAGSVISVGELALVNNSTLILGANIAYAGLFDDDAYGQTTIDLAGHTLSLSGTDDLLSTAYSATTIGAGTITLSGSTTIGGSAFVLGGTGAIVNSGSVVENGAVQVGDGSGGIATITNSATGTWQLTTNATMGVGSNANSSFTNAGLFENTGSDDNPGVLPVFSNSGTVDAVSASAGITFLGGGAFSGTLAGAGEIIFGGGGVYTVAKAAAMSVASFGVEGTANVTFAASSRSYSGTFTETSGAVIDLASGTTLTLKGASALGGSVLGSGEAILSGSSTFSTDGLILGGSAVLEDDKTVVTQGAQATIGNGSSSTASLSILAGGTYRITADTGIGSNGTGAIVNAGLFEKSAGTGTSMIDPLVTNSGTLAAASGTLSFAADVTNNGTATASAGHTLDFATSLTSSSGDTGVIDLTDGGLAQFGGYVGSSQTLSFLDGSISSASLSDPGAFAASISGFGGSNALYLNGVSNVSANYAGNASAGVLTLTEQINGSTDTVAQLQFTGDYVLKDFKIANFEGNNVEITYAGTGAAAEPAIGATIGMIHLHG